MHAAQWVEIFSRIPRAEQNVLLLGMGNGCEIAVQDLLRVDEGYVLIRGRIGGTTDAGRLFCIPYQQLTFFGFTRQLPEESIIRIFGELLHTLEEDGPLREEALVAEEVEEEAALETPEADPTQPVAPLRVEPAAPSPIRERLRKRLAAGGKS